MWTKRGPGTPARGAATLRLAGLAWQGRPPPAAPTSEPRPAITLLGERWRGLGQGHRPGEAGCPWSPAWWYPSLLLVQTMRTTVAGLGHISPPPPVSAPPTSHPPPPASRPRPSTTSGRPGQDRRPLLGPADRGLGLGGIGLLGQLRATQEGLGQLTRARRQVNFPTVQKPMSTSPAVIDGS